MGATESKNQEEFEIRKFLRPGIKIQDIKNISKAFKLLDKDNDGVIMYDIGKISDSKLLYIKMS